MGLRTKTVVKTEDNKFHIQEFEDGSLVADYISEEDPRKQNWVELKRNLFYSALFQRAVAESTTINQTIFSALATTLSDGVLGNAKESTVLYLLGKLNMTFSESEKAELNGYFEANNFTIRL